MKDGVRGREIGGWRKIWTNGGGRAQLELGWSSLSVSMAQGVVWYLERSKEKDSSPLSSSDWVTMTQSIPLIFFFLISGLDFTKLPFIKRVKNPFYPQ